MIRSFRCAETERLFRRETPKRFPPELHRRALRKLLVLDAAESLEDVKLPPSNRLEKLTGDRAGRYSIRINGRWRLCFQWSEGLADQVEIVDDH